MPEDLNMKENQEPFIVDDEGVEPLVEEVLDANASDPELESELARARVASQMMHLRHQVTLMKLRLQIMSERARLTVAAQTNYISTAAHDQLGDYPWAKLFAASCAAFIAGRLMRR